MILNPFSFIFKELLNTKDFKDKIINLINSDKEYIEKGQELRNILVEHTALLNLDSSIEKELFKEFKKEDIIKNMMYSYKDGMILSSYGKDIQFGQYWCDYTEKTRGVILNITTGDIIAYPLDKFFNIDEIGIPKVAIDNIPKHTKFEAIEKMDGALGIMYFNPMLKEYAISTKGSFYSEEAEIGSEILKRKYSELINKHEDLVKDYSFCFEIITPKSAHILDYGEKEDIFLLAVRNNISGALLTQKEVTDLANKLGFPRPSVNTEEFNNIKEFVEIVKEEVGIEGYVLYFNNGLILKVKTEEYFTLHRSTFGFTLNQVLKNIKRGTLDEYETLLPEEFLPQLNRYKDTIHNLFMNNFKAAYNYVKSNKSLSRKDFFIKFNTDKTFTGFQRNIIATLATNVYVNNYLYNFNDIIKNKDNIYDSLVRANITFIKDILTKSNVVILVGIPGAGKSTYLENQRKEEGFIVLSSDEIGKELNGQYGPNNHEVFEILKQRLDELLKGIISNNKRHHIYIDATNMSEKDRGHYLTDINRAGVLCNCVFLNIHPSIAIERDALRKGIKEVGKHVIWKMFNRLEKPHFKEGFDTLSQIDITTPEFNKNIAEQVEILKGLASEENSDKKRELLKDFYNKSYEYLSAVGMDQTSEYHSEDVRTHMEQVVENAVKYNYSPTVLISTLFHDIGKVYAQRWNPDYNRYTFDGHGNVSVKLLDLFYKQYISEIPNINYDEIRFVVKHHNDMDRWKRWYEKDLVENSSLNEKEFYKSKLSEYIDDYGLLNVQNLLNHWICDKEGGDRTLEQVEVYNKIKLLYIEALAELSIDTIKTDSLKNSNIAKPKKNYVFNSLKK